MKSKLLLFGLAGLFGVLAFVEDASAFFLRRRCCDKYQSVIICRPYNAFTPICFGNMTCNGCCPSPCAAPSCLPSFQPWCAPPMNGCDPCMGGGFAAPPVAAMPPYAAPMPTGPVANNGMQPIYQAGYQPAYYPNYNPMQNYYPGYYPMYPMNSMPAYAPMPMPYHPGYGYPGYSR